MTPESKKRTKSPMPDAFPASHPSGERSPNSDVNPKLELNDDDDETTDEDDLDGGMVKKPEPSKRGVGPAEARSPIPALRASSTVTPSPALGSPRPKLGAIGSRKTTMTDKQDSKSTTPETENLSTPDPPPSKSASKLGKIGGRKAPEPTLPLDSTRNTEEKPGPEEKVAMSDAAVSSTLTTKRKLGKIGGQRPTPSVAAPSKSNELLLASHPVTENVEPENVEPDSVAPSIEPAPTTAPSGPSIPGPAPPEEDARTKANRKRDEMKKELETAKPAPKKKRRF